VTPHQEAMKMSEKTESRGGSCNARGLPSEEVRRGCTRLRALPGQRVMLLKDLKGFWTCGQRAVEA